MEFGSVRLNGIARLSNAGTQLAFECERDCLRAGFERLAAAKGAPLEAAPARGSHAREASPRIIG
jgi:hypothetical protein